MRYAFASLLALASAVSAVGNAVVENKSTSKFYLWSVGGAVGDRQAVEPGAQYSEALRRDPTTGGISIKITKTDDGLYTGAPTQQFAYSLDGEQVWYDLSTTFGDPFNGQRVTVTSGGGGTIDWPRGTNPGGSQVKVTSSDDNVVLTVYGSA